MAQTIRISLATYNALTDTDPNHFALYADGTVDYTLIKESARSSASLSNSTSQNVAHGLGYVPLCFVFAERSSGVYEKLFGYPLATNSYWFETNATNLVLYNYSGGTKTFKYYIFYDVVV